MSITWLLTAIFLALVALSLEALYARHRQKALQRHDNVLFPLCQLRRDIMRFLYESAFEKPGALSREEYASVRRLSNALDGAINNYNQHKTTMFNIRKVAQYLRRHRDIIERAEPVDVTDNAAIQKFHARFSECLIKAFLAYTPLIRSGLALKLIAAAHRARKKETRRHEEVEYVVLHAEKIRSDARRYGLIDGGAQPA